MATGTTTVDFGAFPGASDTSTTITGQTSILSGSLVEAWIFPSATSDHGVGEHLVENIRVIAGNVVAGTGFTIYAFVEDDAGAENSRIYGQWTVAWAWA